MLKKLTSAFGVSGYEDEVRNIIKEEMVKSCDSVTTDTLGNLICFKKGNISSNKKIMLAAHMDEVGLIISAFTKEGYLKFKTVGGIDPRVLISKRVYIGEKKVNGVIGIKPPHQKSKDDKKAMKAKELFIDIGAKDEEEAKKHVNIGDYVMFNSEYIDMHRNIIKAKALDDRVGCYILMELSNNNYPYDTYFVFTVQEEIGCNGAETAAYQIKPDIALVLEGTTCNDVPGSNEYNYSTRLGKGVAISIMDRSSYSDKTLVERLSETAKKHNIQFQYKKTTFGGNDAGKIHTAVGGIRTAVLSVPCRYIHSPSSVAAKTDIESSYNLVNKFLMEADDSIWNY